MFPVIRRAASGCAVLSLLLLTTGPLHAHGILKRSSPRANAVLPGAPSLILLEFSEAVDPRFSQAVIVGPQGRALARGGEVSPDGLRLRLPIEGAGEGLYTVRWRVLSAVDGHTAGGSFFFAVGAAAALPASPAPGPAAFPPLLLVAARWFSYLGALLLAGTVLFDAVVARRAMARMDPALSAVATGPISADMRRLRMTSGLIVLAALVFEFAVQGSEVLASGMAALLRRDIISSLLTQTRVGWSILLRTYAAVLLLLPDGPSGRILRAAGLIWLVVFTAVVTFLGGPAALGSSHVALIVLVGTVYGTASILAAQIIPAIPDVTVPAWPGASVIAAGTLLAGFTLVSHAAGSAAVLTAFDWLHLMAAAVWIGGLPALIVVLHRVPAGARLNVGRRLVPRVSQLAGVSLLVMVLTGAAASWRFVGSLQALEGTLYGRSLLIKLALVAVMAALGALNRFALRPRIAEQDERALRRFQVSVLIEVALGAAVLLIVAALGITVPAATAMRPVEESILYAGTLNGRRVIVRVTPGEPGINEVAVEEGRASVRLRRLETLRESVVRPGGSVELTEGWWELVVIGEKAQTVFPLLLGSSPAGSDPEAVRVLARAEAVMGRVRTWRELERITDGNGHVVETQFEAVRPDRLRYRTTSGSETVIIGAVRHSRDQSGPWTRDLLPQPIRLDGPYVQYLDDPAAVRLGGEDRCGAEPCRVVLWSLSSGQAHFAARVGQRSGRIYDIAMVAPGHYMTSRLNDLNAPLSIAPP